MDITPVWRNYRDWEDYKNKMYENNHEEEIIKQCYQILTSNNLKEHMENTTISYPISTQVNFTNKMFNPVSWLGQATCNLLIGASARETCQAWLRMDEKQQKKANKIAKEVIEKWRKENESL